ncbi:MAG TPA: thiamine ABC transporter substrate-binding protein, partial [Tianweitania sediminis]|nr:thiamine ABC transporter substrate-binding protein [Tianweitania sediminis]
AKRFMAFMLTPAFQDAVPETNWMFPAAKTSEPLDPAFDKLVEPTKTLSLPSEEIAAHRKQWVDEWLAVMSR